MYITIALALALQAEIAPAPTEVETVSVAEESPLETVPADAGEVASEPTMDTAAIALAPETEPEPEPVVLIPRDTPVRLMVLNEVSTKDHEPGHRFRLRVNEPVVIDGVERISVGDTAWGELLEAEKSGNVGKSGKLSARLLHLDFDGREIPIEGDTIAKGKSGKGETILGVVGLGPFGLFAKGNNAKIKAGEMMTAFISEDVMEQDAP